MSTAVWYALVGAGLTGIGLHCLVLAPNMLRKIIALNIMGNGVFLVLVSISKRLPAANGPAPDPVPQAMVLTGVVVAISSTALALAVLRRYYEVTGQMALPEDTNAWSEEDQPPAHVLPPEDAEDADGH